jgi:hypothetical protein
MRDGAQTAVVPSSAKSASVFAKIKTVPYGTRRIALVLSRREQGYSCVGRRNVSFKTRFLPVTFK